MLCPRLYKELPLLLHASERADLSVIRDREIIRYDHRTIDSDQVASAYYYRIVCSIQAEKHIGKFLIRLVSFTIEERHSVNI